MLSGCNPQDSPLLDGNFLDSLPAAVYVCDVTGVIQYFNHRAAALWGRLPRCGDTDQRFCGSLRLFHPDGTLMPHHSTPLAEALRTRQPQHNKEAVIERPDGSRITVLITVDLLLDTTGTMLGAVNVFQDITDKKRAEQYRATQLEITQILAQATDFNEAVSRILQTICERLDWRVGIFWSMGLQANALHCVDVWSRSPLQIPEFEAASRRLTCSPGVGLPGSVWARGEPIWLPDCLTAANFLRAPMAAQEGLHSGFACPILLDQACLAVIEFFSEERRAPDDDLLQMMAGIDNQIGQFLDRMQAEVQLRRSEQELADFFNNAAIGLHWIGPDGTILRANQAELQLLGYTQEEYIGHSITEFHADQHVIADLWQRLQAGEEVHDYEARLVCKDGTLKHVLIDSNVLWERDVFIHTRCFTRDITAEKRNETLLAGQKRILELIVQGVPIDEVLEAICELVYEQSTEPLIATILLLDKDGMHLWPVAGRRAPEGWTKAITPLKIGPSVGSCGTAAHRGEQVIAADIASDPLWAEFRDLALSHGLRSCWSTPIFSSQRQVLGTFALYGDAPRTPMSHDLQLVDIVSRTAGIAIERQRSEETLRHLTDTLAQRVTERTAELSQANAALQAEMLHHKQAREQLERQQETLAHREKLAAMGSMLASVAHELNNPLAVAMMQAELLREEAGTGPLATYAAELSQATERCVEIVHNFLSLARQQPPKRSQVALNEVIEMAMKLLAYPLRVDTIVVKRHLAPDLPVLWADPHQLQQVVVNLITNAHQALRETAGPRQLRLTTRTDPTQQRVVLEVMDTGPGIPADVRERIFEPFFTTKPAGVGTGLGLPFCLGIIDGHGGTITVDSAPGGGTVVRVELPVEPMPTDVPSPVSAAPSTPKGKTILIVDDEPGIVRALARLLQRDGHRVETAANGRLALEKCQTQDYELILCDLRMPELDGPGFYRALKRHCPHLCQHIMFLTGDTLSPEAQTFLEHTGVPRLNKPFTAAMVRQVIQRF